MCPGCLHASAVVRGLPAYIIRMSGNAYFEQQQERESVWFESSSFIGQVIKQR